MTTPLELAAAELLRKIDAPAGAVNTLAVIERRQKVIRVLVESSYWYRLRSVPKTFKGFSVRVEKRGAIEIGDTFLSRSA